MNTETKLISVEISTNEDGSQVIGYFVTTDINKGNYDGYNKIFFFSYRSRKFKLSL